MAQSNQKVEILLPYGTTSDNIVKLLDAIKNKQGDEKGIKAVYTGSKFDSTQATLETLKIISGISLTEIGKSIVFESDSIKKEAAFLKAVLGYPPYEYFLTFVTQSMPVVETEIDALKNFWGKNNYGTANSRSEAAPVCFSIFQLAGLGEYIIGRKGKSTRFVWKENFDEIIKEAQSNDNISSETDEALVEYTTDTPGVKVENNAIDINDSKPNENVTFSSPVVVHQATDIGTIIPASLEIKVDMTEWELDRIEKFFDIIKGERVKSE